MSDLPAGWIATTIGAVTVPVQKHRPEDLPDVRFQYIDIASVDNRQNVLTEPKCMPGSDAPSRARQLVHTGDTLLSTVRTYLRNTAQVPASLDGATASTGFCVLRPAPGVVARFLFYRTLEGDFVNDLSARQTGTSYPAVRDADVRDIGIAIPPLTEQQRIVEAIEEQFSRLDAGGASLQRAKRNLARMRASVLAAAVEGRLVARSLEDKSPSLFLDRLHAVRAKTPAAPDSDLPISLPSHWEVTSLGGLVEHLRYGTSTKCDYTGTGAPVLRIPNVRGRTIDTTDLKRAIDSTVSLDAVKVRTGDLLFIRTNGSPDLIGRVGVVPEAVNAYAFASYLIRGRLLAGVSPFFYAIVLQSGPYRKLLRSRAATSAGQYNVSASTLARIPLPVPPVAEQQRIVAEVDRQFSILDAMDATVSAGLARADRLRQSILREAFTGRLVRQDLTDTPPPVPVERIKSNRVTA